jgi:hypothetical protein
MIAEVRIMRFYYVTELAFIILQKVSIIFLTKIHILAIIINLYKNNKQFYNRIYLKQQVHYNLHKRRTSVSSLYFFILFIIKILY